MSSCEQDIEFQEDDLTDLQKAVPRENINRNYYRVEVELSGAIDMDAEIMDFAKRQDEVVVLDAGCGSGAAIEEIVRLVRPHLKRTFGRNRELRGIGIDENPVPQLISSEIRSINPRNGRVQKGKTFPLVASIRKDDITKLETVPSDSVDFLYSAVVLPYVADTLSALEACWRVLKTGGMMCHAVPWPLITRPHISHILADTDGGSSFFLKQGAGKQYVMAIKKPDSLFRGFPYEMSSVSQFDPKEDRADRLYSSRSVHRNFFQIGAFGRKWY